MRSRALITTATKYRCLTLLIMLLGILIITNSSVLRFQNSYLFNYVFKPALWLMVAFVIRWFPRTRVAGKLRLKRFLNILALVCAGFYILFILGGGLIDGLGKSPYSFTPLGIINNLLTIVTMVVGMELSRAFLINNLAIKRVYLTIGVISIFFTAFCLSWLSILNLKTGLKLVEYTGVTIIPTFLENVLLSYFAYLGGPVTAIVYHGTMEAFRWFSPILPNTSFITGTFIGCFVPGLCLILVNRFYMMEAREQKRTSIEKEGPVGWIVSSVFSVLVIWFVVGLFPIYPSVVLTGSMQPLIKPGDIVIVKKIGEQDRENINIGEIIQFRNLEQEISITHRVINIDHKEGLKYQTKGDHNSSPDGDLVMPKAVRGKIISVVPKLGLPTLIFKSREGIPSQKVEF